MKKLFTMILIAAAVVGCSTDINEDMSVKVGPRYTAPFAVDFNETDARSFDADLNWVWDADDTILAYQAEGGKHLNTLTILDNGKFGVESFGYDSQDAADFVFVHPAEAFNAESYTVKSLQTGEWTPVMLGRATDATIDNIESVSMQYLNAAVEFRFWEAGATKQMNVTEVSISSESNFIATWNELGEQTLDGKFLLKSGIKRNNYTFNIGTGTFPLTLKFKDENRVEKVVEIPAKTYNAGSRTIINVEWKPAISVAVSSWWTDQSKADGNTIYLDVTTDRAAEYVVLLDGATATVTDGKISNVTPGEHTVRARVRLRDGSYINSDKQIIMVTGKPSFSYKVYSSYNSNDNSVSKDNSKDGRTFYYSIGNLSGDTNDYIKNNLVESVVLTYGSNSANVALGASNQFSGLTPGQYNSYVKCTLKNGYVLGGESTQTPIHITGIPHLATPPTEALGWSEGSWNVEWTGSHVKLGGVSGSGEASITSPAFHVPSDFGVKVDMTGTIHAFNFFGWINTTFTVKVSGSNVISIGSGSKKEHDMSGSGSGTLKSSNPRVVCNSSYTAAGPYAKVKTLKITYL